MTTPQLGLYKAPPPWPQTQTLSCAWSGEEHWLPFSVTVYIDNGFVTLHINIKENENKQSTSEGREE